MTVDLWLINYQEKWKDSSLKLAEGRRKSQKARKK